MTNSDPLEGTDAMVEIDESAVHQREMYMSEASISVSFTSFMSVVVFFFVGLLLTGSPDLQIRLRVPLVFLFFSSFGFLYSTLIYANASGEIARLRKHDFPRQMLAADIISEYFGVYCLVFAIPIIVLGYSPDRTFAIVALVVSDLGFIMYHQLGYSVLEWYIAKPGTNRSRKRLYFATGYLLVIHLAAFLTFYYEAIAAFYILSTVLLLSIFGLFIFSLKKGESEKRKQADNGKRGNENRE